MVNSPDQIFVKRHRGTSGYHDEAFNDDDHVVRTLTKILDEAAGSHRKLDPAEDCRTPSSTPAPGCTSSMATWAVTATSS